MPQLPVNPSLDVTKTICANFVTHVSATGSPAAHSVLYLGSAGSAWAAAAFMTGSGARVATVWTRQHAGLLAAAFCQALAPVTDPSAAVLFAWQHFIACQATGNVLQMTWDVAALLWARRRVSLKSKRIKKIKKATDVVQILSSEEVTSCFPMHHF